MIRFAQVSDIGYWGLFYHREAGVVTDEFRDLSGLFQPLKFYDSVICSKSWREPWQVLA